jgi:hypothetical protein
VENYPKKIGLFRTYYRGILVPYDHGYKPKGNINQIPWGLKRSIISVEVELNPRLLRKKRKKKKKNYIYIYLIFNI